MMTSQGATMKVAKLSTLHWLSTAAGDKLFFFAAFFLRFLSCH